MSPLQHFPTGKMLSVQTGHYGLYLHFGLWPGEAVLTIVREKEDVTVSDRIKDSSEHCIEWQEATGVFCITYICVTCFLHQMTYSSSIPG